VAHSHAAQTAQSASFAVPDHETAGARRILIGLTAPVIYSMIVPSCCSTSA
jgi:hypothetical protein